MIKVSSNQVKGILSVPDKCDRLVGFPGDINVSPFSKRAIKSVLPGVTSITSVVYEFDFGVDVASALVNNAMVVKVEAYVIKEAPPQNEKLTSSKFVGKVLQQPIIEKKSIEDTKHDILAAVNIDVSSKINNEKTRMYSSGGDLSGFNAKKKKVIVKKISDLDSENKSIPVIAATMLDYTVTGNTTKTQREIATDLLLDGIDPASISEYKTTISSVASSLGVSRLSKKRIGAKTDALLKQYFFSFVGPQSTDSISSDSINASGYVHALATTTSKYTDYIAVLKLPGALVSNKFYVKLSLLNAEGVTIDSIVRTIDHYENVKLYSMPTVAPSIMVKRNSAGLGKSMLYVKQNDKNATGFVVYRRVIARSASMMASAYEKIAEVAHTIQDGTIAIPTMIDTTNTVVFRCIPFGMTGELASIFSTAIISSAHIRNQLVGDRFNYASIIARSEKQGVAIEIREYPAGIVGMKVMRRDRSIHEKDYSPIENFDDIVPVNEQSAQPIAFIDTGVRAGHVYEYKCVAYSIKGDVFDIAKTALIEHIPFVDNIVDTALTGLVVTNATNASDLDVSFDIATEVIESTVQSVKSMIDAYGLTQYFSENINDEKTLLQQLLAHEVKRYNMTTGEAESFGTLTGQTFSDKRLREVNVVKPLQRGMSYRYDVMPLLRAPDSMLEKFVTTVSGSGQQSYSFNPAKYFHPLIKLGNITTPESRKRNHAKDEMVFGRVGTVASVDTFFGKDAAGVLDAVIERITDRKIVIHWRMSADVTDHDHFLILKESMGTREFVAVCHAISSTGKYSYLHELHDDDIGMLQFKIIPVLLDYSVGAEVSTEQVLVI